MQGVSRLVAAIACFALVGLATAASAADVPARSEKAPMYAVPIQSWTGLYLGLNGGGGFGSANLAMAGSSFSTQGWVYGAQMGYNVQMGRIVLGLESDLDATSLGGTSNSGTCGAAGCEVRNRWVGTVRGRAGYAVDSFLPYLTGGVAVGDLTASSAVGSTSATRTGYALGAGLEFPIAGRWSARGEYMFIDLGSLDCAGCGGPVPNRASFYTNMYRAAVNFRF